MGTWGVYAPGLQPDDVPEALKEVGHLEQVEGGTLVYGQTQGPALSSARQEAIALYAALALPHPHVYGIDNAAVVKRAKEHLKHCNPRRKPWGSQPDGDVWESIVEVLQRRTCGSVRVKKVKGHAKDEHVLSGGHPRGETRQRLGR